MKWNTSSDPALGSRADSSTNGLDLAKLLCTVRIISEFDSDSPLRPASKPVVKSLNSCRDGPISILARAASGPPVERASLDLSLFRTTESIACVPHAFWIVWAAKKSPSSSTAFVSYEPSCGVPLFSDDDPIHLKRKITP